MSRLLTGRRAIVMCFVLILALVVAACGGDDDDPTATTAASSPTETPAPVAQQTPTPASEEATPTEAATATMPPATATPTQEATATTQAAATPTSAASPTADATATIDPEEDPLGDVEMLDPEAMPNYTLTFRLDAEGFPEEPEPITMELEVQQSDLDNYHMRMAAPDLAIEIWVVDEVTYLAEGNGEITQIPGSDMGLFSPSMFLSTIPPITPEMEAARVGEETVSGRRTTHYRISAEDFLAMDDMFPEGEKPTDAQGDVQVWVDNELNIMIRQAANVTWTNADGTAGRYEATYLVSDIGSTPRVEPPQ